MSICIPLKCLIERIRNIFLILLLNLLVQKYEGHFQITHSSFFPTLFNLCIYQNYFLQFLTIKE